MRKKLALKRAMAVFLTILLMLTFVGQTLLAGPGEQSDMRGWDKARAGAWQNGNLTGYSELDWVNFKIVFSNYKGSVTSLDVFHDYSYGTVIGYERSGIEWLGIGPDKVGLPGAGDITITPGTAFSVSGYSDIDDGAIHRSKYTVTFTDVNTLKGMDEGKGNFALYWRVRLSNNSSQWPGAKLHTNRSGGSETISMNTNQIAAVNPALSLTKAANPTSAVVGQNVTYTYTVTNSGDVPITGVSITDNKIIGAIAVLPATIAPGGAATGTAVYQVVKGDLPGPLVNTAIANGVYNGLAVQSPPASASVALGTAPEPGITVTKTASPTAVTVGEPIFYSYTVTNSGNVTLTDVALSDNKLGSITLAKNTLALGESTIGSASHDALDSEVGTLTNTATATGRWGQSAGDVVTATASASVTVSSVFVPVPGITVTKTASPTAVTVGEPITYSYTVTNSGNVTLTEVALSDDKLGAVTLSKNTLATGESVSVNVDHTALIGEVGTLKNTATATGRWGVDTGNVVTATASASVTVNSAFVPAPGITVTKTANPTSVTVGEPITYSYNVTNSGNVDLTEVALSDDKLGVITLAKDTLDPGESTIGSASHDALDSEVGTLNNTATATGRWREGTDGVVTASASASVTVSSGSSFIPAPGITVTKTASPTSVTVGGTITYNYTVTNSGNMTLTGVTLNDDKLGVITLSQDSLDPGESVTGSASHVAQTGEIGTLTNIATAQAFYGQEQSVRAQASASVTVSAAYIEVGGGDRGGGDTTPSGNPAVSLVKTADRSAANVGDTVTYTYTVTNTGDVSLSNITVIDTPLGPVTLDTTSLAVGAKATGTLKYTVLASDLPGPLTNKAVAKGYYANVYVESTASTSVSLGQGITVPVEPPVAAPPPVKPQPLPYTGGDPGVYAGLGMMLTLAGALIRQK